MVSGAMSKTLEPVPRVGRVDFELDRFKLLDHRRWQVRGRWSGVRGRRFMRPALTLVVDGRPVRLLADLEHKPWAAEDGEPWMAEFPWSLGAAAIAQAELTVAPDITIALPPPGGRAAARRLAPRDQAAAQRDQAAAQRDQARRERDEAIAQRDEARRERDRLASELDELRRGLEDLAAERDAAHRERDELAAQRDAARRERDEAARLAEREAAARERALGERGSALAAQAQAESERDGAIAERDRAVAEREGHMPCATTPWPPGTRRWRRGRTPWRSWRRCRGPASASSRSSATTSPRTGRRW